MGSAREDTLTLARMCLSLMMYSYVVSRTLNLPLRSWGTKARLAAGDPCGDRTHVLGGKQGPGAAQGRPARPPTPTASSKEALQQLVEPWQLPASVSKPKMENQTRPSRPQPPRPPRPPTQWANLETGAQVHLN